LELGGKSPFIIFEDCDLDKAIHATVLANFLNQGEVCTNATRIFVEQSILEKFQSKLLEELEKIKVGDPLDETNNVGALINEGHLNKVATMVEHAVKEVCL
jgi:acyl-CoA reductase-like NAD-dependent aldehyde dehydrogenase